MTNEPNGTDPVVVILHGEVRAFEDTEAIARDEWDAMTPTQRATVLDGMADESMNNAGGYGYTIADEDDAAAVGELPRPVTAASADPRRAIYDIVTEAVAKGLPLPANIQIPGHYDLATIQLPRNDKAGVDAWVAYLNLPQPQLEAPLAGLGNRCYSVDVVDLPAVPGWHITVQCFCTEDGTR